MHFEMVLFFQSVCLGAILILAYDVRAALRKVIPHGTLAVSCEDLLYWIAAALIVFALLYQANQGILRSFLFLGMSLGAILCSRIISPFFIKFLAFIFGIPVIFAKFSTDRLLFLVKRCRITLCKFADSADRKKKARFLRLKRSKQVERVKKRKRKKNNE